MKHLRRLWIASAALVVVLLIAGTAFADKPDLGSFDNGVETFIDQDVCAAAPWGFDVTVVQHVYGSFRAFSDTEEEIHVNYDATISANGKTIVERDTWNIMDGPHDGTFRFMGSTVHIQGPGGIVVRDAGEIVFNDDDASIVFAHGPHEQLVDGVSFCPALAP